LVITRILNEIGNTNNMKNDKDTVLLMEVYNATASNQEAYDLRKAFVHVGDALDIVKKYQHLELSSDLLNVLNKVAEIRHQLETATAVSKPESKEPDSTPEEPTYDQDYYWKNRA